MKEEEATTTTTTATRNTAPEFAYTEDVLLPSLTLFLTRVRIEREFPSRMKLCSIEFRMGIAESRSTSSESLSR